MVCALPSVGRDGLERRREPLAAVIVRHARRGECRDEHSEVVRDATTDERERVQRLRSVHPIGKRVVVARRVGAAAGRQGGWCGLDGGPEPLSSQTETSGFNPV